MVLESLLEIGDGVSPSNMLKWNSSAALVRGSSGGSYVTYFYACPLSLNYTPAVLAHQPMTEVVLLPVVVVRANESLATGSGVVQGMLSANDSTSSTSWSEFDLLAVASGVFSLEPSLW
jgi:hypothetical protein